MILPLEFFRILNKNLRVNRLTARKIASIGGSHENLESIWEESSSAIKERSIIKYAKERLSIEASTLLHDENLTHIRFKQDQCPMAYDLLINNRMTAFLSEEDEATTFEE
jgi:sialic acid synthase SpsE